jgi:hypothetical protein
MSLPEIFILLVQLIMQMGESFTYTWTLGGNDLIPHLCANRISVSSLQQENIIHTSLLWGKIIV